MTHIKAPKGAAFIKQAIKIKEKYKEEMSEKVAEVNLVAVKHGVNINLSDEKVYRLIWATIGAAFQLGYNARQTEEEEKS